MILKMDMNDKFLNYLVGKSGEKKKNMHSSSGFYPKSGYELYTHPKSDSYLGNLLGEKKEPPKNLMENIKVSKFSSVFD